jgi:hypothetical protein
VSNSEDLAKYGTPDSEYLAAEEGCTSSEDHLDCQSNHKYLEGSLFSETKNGTSRKVEFNEL